MAWTVRRFRAAPSGGFKRARAGDGPTVLECLTYRLTGSFPGRSDELRSEAEKAFWASAIQSRPWPLQLISGELATGRGASKAIESGDRRRSG